ncbi:MAG: GNAT family N-acetyltransferase [Nocardioides sp.]
MQLRFATGGAAEGWAQVRVAASPYLLATEASVRHDLAEDTNTLARYVVVEHGEVLGIGRVRRHPDEEPSVMVMVHPDHAGRGVGRCLLDRLLEVVGDVTASALVNGDDRSLAVAAHWGFVPEREHRVSAVDPRTAPEPAATPAGLRVVPLDVPGPRAVWECRQATAADDPSGLTRPAPCEHFLGTDWSGPLHRADLGRAVLEGERVLAYTQVDVAGDRAWTTMTGCLPEHRGRGLATLAKAHSLRALAGAGVTQAGTGNDGANAAMLAVNRRLGYRPIASTWTATRAADGAGPVPPR